MAASVSWVPGGIRQRYAAILKLTVIKHAEKNEKLQCSKNVQGCGS
jgi:hypothetical protein